MTNDSGTIRVNWLVDLAVLIVASVQFGILWEKVASLETKLTDIQRNQITDGRIVRLEEQQKYLVRQVEEINQLLKAYIAEQRELKEVRK